MRFGTSVHIFSVSAQTLSCFAKVAPGSSLPQVSCWNCPLALTPLFCLTSGLSSVCRGCLHRKWRIDFHVQTDFLAPSLLFCSIYHTSLPVCTRVKQICSAHTESHSSVMSAPLLVCKAGMVRVPPVSVLIKTVICNQVTHSVELAWGPPPQKTKKPPKNDTRSAFLHVLSDQKSDWLVVI